MITRPLCASVRKEANHYLSLDESALLSVMGGNEPLWAFGETTQPYELGGTGTFTRRFCSTGSCASRTGCARAFRRRPSVMKPLDGE